MLGQTATTATKTACYMGETESRSEALICFSLHATACALLYLHVIISPFLQELLLTTFELHVQSQISNEGGNRIALTGLEN